MSKLRIQNPVIHIPSFKEYIIDGMSIYSKITSMGYKMPLGLLDSTYYYTDLEGWGSILWDLTFNSNLYKADRFDCENMAFKAMNLCAEKYGLNTLGVVIGNIPQGRHGFNILFHGDGFKLFEPNFDFGYDGLFEIGEHGYIVDWVII